MKNIGAIIMKIREKYTCPLELTHDITRGKWKPIILWQLKNEKKSLSSLEKEITWYKPKNAFGTIKGAYGIRNG